MTQEEDKKLTTFRSTYPDQFLEYTKTILFDTCKNTENAVNFDLALLDQTICDLVQPLTFDINNSTYKQQIETEAEKNIEKIKKK